MEDKEIRKIGDKVWILDNQKIKELKIKEVRYVFETLTKEFSLPSTNVFSSKEELVESLTYQIIDAHK